MSKIPLKNLCYRIGDGLHGTPTYDSESKIYFINGNNLKNGKIEITENTNSVSNEDYKKNFIGLNENSLLLSINGTLGSMAFYNNEKVMLGKSAAYLNFKNGINKFYYYYFQLKEIQEYFHNVATGSTIKNLSLKSIQDFEVPIPQEEEWQKIAKVLSTLDAKIELNNRINKELEAMAKTLYDYWFVQFDFPNVDGKPYKSSGGKMVYNEELKREIPHGWEVKTISKLLNVVTGKEDANFAVENGKYPFFTCSETISSCDKYAFEGKAILIAGNGNFNVKLYEGKFNAYQRTYVLIPNEEKYYSVVFYAVKDQLKKLSSSSAGSIIKFITKGDVDNIPLILPTFGSDKIFNKLNNIIALIEKNLEQNQELAKLRDFLLPMLMNGQVSVKS